jgi:hypothetical protein
METILENGLISIKELFPGGKAQMSIKTYGPVDLDFELHYGSNSGTPVLDIFLVDRKTGEKTYTFSV